MRCGAKTRDGDPCRNPPMRGARRCRMHGAATRAARRAAERRLLEAEMRSVVGRFLAQREAELAELRAHGLTPYVRGLQRGLGGEGENQGG